MVASRHAPAAYDHKRKVSAGVQGMGWDLSTHANFMNIFNPQVAKPKDADRVTTPYTNTGNGSCRVAAPCVTPCETEAAVCMHTHTAIRVPLLDVERGKKFFICQTSSHPDYSSTKKGPGSHV